MEEPGGEEPPGSLTQWHPVALLALGFGFYYALRLIWAGSDFLLVAFLGVLFGLALSRAVDRLPRGPVPRGVMAAALVLAFYGLLGGAGALVAPTIRHQASELQQRLPQALERADAWLAEHSDGLLGTILETDRDAGDAGQEDPRSAAADTSRPAAEAGRAERETSTRGGADTALASGSDTAGPGGPDTALANGSTAAAAAGAAGGTGADGEFSAIRDRLGEIARGSSRYLQPFVSGTLSAISALLLTTVIAIYLAAEPKTYRRGVMHLIPERARPRAAKVMDETAEMLRKWLLAQLVAMAVIGAVTTGVLMLLDVEAAFALGIIAGLLEFVPIAGPIIAAIPAIGMAFLQSPQTALYVTIAFIVIQQLESNVLTPLVMKHGLEMPPILTLASQGIMTLLFGFLGLLVAVPLAAAIIVPVQMLYVRKLEGEEPPGAPQG